MKRVLMICITAAVMMAALAAFGRVIVAPAFGWGYSRTGDPIRIRTVITFPRLAQ